MTRLCLAWSGIALLCFLLAACSSEEPPPLSGQEQDTVEALKKEGPTAVKEASSGQPDQQTRDATEVDNQPPIVSSVKISPFPAYPGTVLVAEVAAEDGEGDPILLEYEWERNGEIVSTGTSASELDTEGFGKGDLISVVVTPSDIYGKGEGQTSSPILLHNRPPEITSTPSFSQESGQYSYQVEASDPDGDELTYSLEDAPPEMVIEPKTGVVRWTAPENAKGAVSVRVIVSDGDAQSFQSFKMTLEESKPEQ